MSWAFLAIVFAGSYGVTNVVQKVLLTRYLPDSSTLIAWFGIAQIVFIVPFAILFPLDDGTPVLSIVSVVGSGVLYGLGFSILLYVIRTAEASRACVSVLLRCGPVRGRPPMTSAYAVICALAVFSVPPGNGVCFPARPAPPRLTLRQRARSSGCMP